MPKKAISGLTAAMLGQGLDPETAVPAEPAPVVESDEDAKAIALTLKVSPALYQRLKFLGVRRRQSNQAILQAALTQYLDREEGGE
jgi:hypothetical protein